MQLRVSVTNTYDNGEIASLYKWLSQDPDVQVGATLSLESSAEKLGTMGASLDLINVVLSNSIATISALVAAVGLWRMTRSREAEVRIEAGAITVVVSDADPDTVRRLVEELNAVPHERPDTADI